MKRKYIYNTKMVLFALIYSALFSFSAQAAECGDTKTEFIEFEWQEVSRPCGATGSPTIGKLFGTDLGAAYGETAGNFVLYKHIGTKAGWGVQPDRYEEVPLDHVMEAGMGYWAICDSNSTWDPGANADTNAIADPLGQWGVITPTTLVGAIGNNDISGVSFTDVVVVDPMTNITLLRETEDQNVLLGNPFPIVMKWEDVHFSNDGTAGIGFETMSGIATGARPVGYVRDTSFAGKAQGPYAIVSTTPGTINEILPNQGFWIMVQADAGSVYHNKRIAMPKSSTGPIPLPPGITLSSKVRYVASVNDDDYLPVSISGPANTTFVAGSNVGTDTLVDIQGIIDTTDGVIMYIPYVATARVTLPAVTATIQTVDASINEDNVSIQVKFSYPEITITAGSGNIIATIKAITTDLKAKRLDVQNGIGDGTDTYMTDNVDGSGNAADDIYKSVYGMFMAEFLIAIDDVDGHYGNIQLRDISGIPDRMLGIKDKGKSAESHRFIYLPVESPETGEFWLNNNLGAEYTDIHSPEFNPAQQAKEKKDYFAYGSLFQWGRNPDGHELITWIDISYGGTPVHGYTGLQADIPDDPLYILESLDYKDWRVNLDDTLWLHENSINNPCPKGWRVPYKVDFDSEIATWAIPFDTAAAESFLAISLLGYRSSTGASLEQSGSQGSYWTATVSGSDFKYLKVRDLKASTEGDVPRATACGVRCIQLIDTDGDGIDNKIDTDDDGDGINDSDEAAIGTDPIVANTPGEDYDNDGISDEDESDESLDTITDIDPVNSISDLLDFNGPIPLPAGVTLEGGKVRYIASSFDEDYLPYTVPTAGATTATFSSDGIADNPTIDIQGSLTTIGLTIDIPYTTTVKVNLPAYTKTITVAAELTQNGLLPIDVSFSYPAKTLLANTTGFITATIQATTSPLDVKKLDTNEGIGDGSDTILVDSSTSATLSVYGVLMAEFTISINSSTDRAAIQLRGIAGIPDKMFGIPDNTGDTDTHLFLYLPVRNQLTGKTWLNNNLGANYADLKNANFDISQQATALDDYLAYGSLFQWGRKPDGHELITWISSTDGSNTNAAVKGTVDEPLHASKIKTFVSDWRATHSSTLWSTVTSANNPCPIGYRLPTAGLVDSAQELELEARTWTGTTANIANTTTTHAFESDLVLTAAGYTQAHNAGFAAVSDTGYYWGSSQSDTSEVKAHSIRIHANSDNTGLATNLKGIAFSVRCVEN